MVIIIRLILITLSIFFLVFVTLFLQKQKRDINFGNQPAESMKIVEKKLQKPEKNVFFKLEEAVLSKKKTDGSDEKIHESAAENRTLMVRRKKLEFINHLWGDLAEELGLGPSDKDQLMRFILEKEMLHREFVQKIINSDGEEIAFQEVEEFMENITEAKERLREFLTDSEHQVYQEYTLTLPLRQETSHFKATLEERGVPLDRESEKKLLNIIWKEWLVAQHSAPFMNPGFSMGQGLEEMNEMIGVEEILPSMETADEHIYEQASEILSNEALLIFKAYQVAGFEKTSYGMMFSREFFRGYQ